MLYHNFPLGMFKNSYPTSGHKNIDVFPKPICFLLNEEFIKALKKMRRSKWKIFFCWKVLKLNLSNFYVRYERTWRNVQILCFELNEEVLALQVHPRCAIAHNCLGPILEGWWNNEVSFDLHSSALPCLIVHYGLQGMEIDPNALFFTFIRYILW